MANIPECPPSFKALQHYMKIAAEHDSRDPIVAYWCRLYALQLGLKITNKKTPEETNVLMATMDWLETIKKSHKDDEAITNEVAAQAHLENYALKLFLFADKQDREESYGKNMVKAFYTAGMIYDVLNTFGELSEEAAQNRKYAKWKAAYIHNCLKNGEKPVPGPLKFEEETGEQTIQPSDDTATPSTSDSSNVPVTPPTNLPLNPGFNNLPDSNTAMQAASKLPPVPYTPDPNPGGFVPYEPKEGGETTFGDTCTGSATSLSPEQLTKAQKYCKWASSALNYEDVTTAVMNLKNALTLLQTGRDPAP